MRYTHQILNLLIALLFLPILASADTSQPGSTVLKAPKRTAASGVEKNGNSGTTRSLCTLACDERYEDPVMRRFCYARFNPSHSAYPGEVFCNAISHSERSTSLFERMNVSIRENITNRLQELCFQGWRNADGTLIDHGMLLPELNHLDEVSNCEDRPEQIPDLAAREEVMFQHTVTPSSAGNQGFDFRVELRNLSSNQQGFVVVELVEMAQYPLGPGQFALELARPTIDGRGPEARELGINLSQTGEVYGCHSMREMVTQLNSRSTLRFGKYLQTGINGTTHEAVRPRHNIFVFRNLAPERSLSEVHAALADMFAANSVCSEDHPLLNYIDPSFELLAYSFKEGIFHVSPTSVSRSLLNRIFQ